MRTHHVAAAVIGLYLASLVISPAYSQHSQNVGPSNAKVRLDIKYGAIATNWAEPGATLYRAAVAESVRRSRPILSRCMAAVALIVTPYRPHIGEFLY